MHSYHVAFLADEPVCLFKIEAQRQLERRLGYPPDSSSPARLVAKRSVELDSSQLAAVKDRLAVLEGSRRILPFQGVLGEPSFFPGTGIVYLPVIGRVARKATLQVLVELGLDFGSFDGRQAFVTIAKVLPEDALEATRLLSSLEPPPTAHFEQLYLYEAGHGGGAHAIACYDLRAVKAA